MDEPKSVTPKRRRRWFSYSLRSLWIFVTLLAIFMAWVVREQLQSRREAQLAIILQESTPGLSVDFAGLYDVPKVSSDNQIWWRKALSWIRGPRAKDAGFDGNTKDFSTFADLSGFAEFTSLESLFVHHSQVKDLTPISGLTNLQYLVIFNSHVKDLSPIAGLHNLVEIQAGECPIDDVTPLAGLVQLRVLGLSGTQVHDVSPLSGLQSLENLWLHRTPVSKIAPLAKLKKLKQLGLAETQVSDPSPLAVVKSLTAVGFNGSPVTQEQVDMLQNSLPRCSISR